MICSKCLIDKEISEYTKKGYICKNCHKIKSIEYKKEYYKNNSEYIKSKSSKYYDENKEYCNNINKEYYLNNKESINIRLKIYRSERKKTDSLYRCKLMIKSIIINSIKRNGFSKKSNTTDILGCSFEDFKCYLESKFESWMNWGNRGLYNGSMNYGWDIDHITPLSTAKTQDDILRLNH